jgi:hypothetical protein
VGTTERLYERVHDDFQQWCRRSGIRQPARPEAVARYLLFTLEQRGPTSVALRASAIGRLYRDQGLVFDTKAPVIQTVLADARAQIRHNRMQTQSSKRLFKREK